MTSSSKDFPGFNEVCLLGDPGSEREFVGDIDLPSGREFDLLRGSWVPAKPLEVRWEMGRTPPSDFVWTTLAVPLVVSDRVLKVLEGFTGWTRYSVLVLDEGGNALPGYSGLAITGRCGAIDNALSTRAIRKFPGGTFPVFVGLRFDEASWDGSDIFCPEDDSGWVFVTPTLRDALQGAKVQNVLFQPAALIERQNL